MTFTTRDLIRRAARNLLAHRDVGRSIDPMSEQWAEGVLKANPADGTFQEPLTRQDAINQPEAP